MTEKRKVKGKVDCPDCGRRFMNAGSLRGHKAYCKGKPAIGEEGASTTPTRRPSATSTGDERSRPQQPRSDAWGPLGGL